MNIGDVYKHRTVDRTVTIVDLQGRFVVYRGIDDLQYQALRDTFDSIYAPQGRGIPDPVPPVPEPSQHPADLKPRGQKAPMYLIPWEVVPDHECPIILRRAGRDPSALASLCLDVVGLEEVARVFEYGAKKYARDNWRTFTWDERAEDEYFGAICRHLVKDFNGETVDPESGCLHVAHAAAGALIWLARRAQPCSP